VFLPFIYAPLIVLPATLSGPPAGGMDIAAKLSVAELVSTIQIWKGLASKWRRQNFREWDFNCKEETE
jgi:hypothetical protein